MDSFTTLLLVFVVAAAIIILKDQTRGDNYNAWADIGPV